LIIRLVLKEHLKFHLLRVFNHHIAIFANLQFLSYIFLNRFLIVPKVSITYQFLSDAFSTKVFCFGLPSQRLIFGVVILFHLFIILVEIIVYQYLNFSHLFRFKAQTLRKMMTMSDQFKPRVAAFLDTSFLFYFRDPSCLVPDPKLVFVDLFAWLPSGWTDLSTSSLSLKVIISVP